VEPFKNIIREESVLYLANHLKRVGLNEAPKRLKKIIPKLDELELKERVTLLKEELKILLPKSPLESFELIEKLLAPLNNRKGLGNKSDQTFKLNPEGLEGFMLWPVSEYVADVGLSHVEASLKVLQEITRRFTAEFAIRPFLIEHPKLVYTTLNQWSTHSCEHVRRLCSEGSRPRLPWGLRLQNAVIDPSMGIEILEKLKYDESLYVRKSIANHLNDVSRDHPKLVIDLFKRWMKEAPSHHQKKIEWIVKHAGRNLIKAGDPAMLKLIGINTKAPLLLTNVKASKKSLSIGETLLIKGVVKNPDTRSHSVLLDYEIEYYRNSGKTAKKVFKGKKANLLPQEDFTFELKIPFKDNSIRTHYSGLHKITLLLNGAKQKVINITLSK
jgi:3-methyladenine DNA glycosylase AlkC